MKARNSFVANSSSSSFIIVGKHMNLYSVYPEADADEFPYELGVQYQKDTGLQIKDLEYSGDCCVGKLIVSGMGGWKMSPGDLVKRIEEAVNYLNERGITDPEVFSGEEDC